MRAFLLLALFLALSRAASVAHALPGAPETGPCSLADAVPATVAAVDDDFDLLLDDGRRAVLSGLEFPAPATNGPDLRAEARKRLSDWLAGREIFLGAFASAVDRWGRLPARVYAAAGPGADAPLVAVAASLLDSGHARFRPDTLAAACAATYLAAEAPAREAARGLWARREARPIDLADHENHAALLGRKDMVVVEGVIRSVGESRGAIYLNFGERRRDDFSVVILRRHLAMFEKSGIMPRALTGRRARVRGLIETGFGSRMEIAFPAEIELIDGAVAP